MMKAIYRGSGLGFKLVVGYGSGFDKSGFF